MKYDDIIKMTQDIWAHGKGYNHKILSADNPGNLIIGFVCIDCRAGKWEINLTQLQQQPNTKVRERFRTSAGRMELANLLSYTNENERKFNLLLA